MAQVSKLMAGGGSELVSLLPVDVCHWLKLIEEVFRNPYLIELSASLLQECYEHEEFEHISIDATIRLLRRVKGQFTVISLAVPFTIRFLGRNVLMLSIGLLSVRLFTLCVYSNTSEG